MSRVFKHQLIETASSRLRSMKSATVQFEHKKRRRKNLFTWKRPLNSAQGLYMALLPSSNCTTNIVNRPISTKSLCFWMLIMLEI